MTPAGRRPTAAPARPQSQFRILAAASLGNALEWYDFTIYVLFATQIARQFFPSGGETAELIKAFLAFGVGFVVRPIGAVLIGRYADRAGRKAALTLTIGLMAGGTLVLAVAPTYAAIGLGAPLLVLAGRILQGFSAGGEIGGAAAFLVEHAPPGRKGVYAAFLQASMAASNILGALVALLVARLLTDQQLDAWGWRIPFFLGLLIAPVGLWLRGAISETPVFEMSRASAHGDITPLRTVVRDHGSDLARGFGLSVLWAVSVYTLIIYMPVFAQKTLHFRPDQTFLAALIGNVLLGVTCFASGLLGDRFGARRILVSAALAMLVGVPPLLLALQMAPTLAMLVLAQCVFCSLVGLFSGVAPAALAELYPPQVRSTGMSLAYNGAVTLFGGFAPAILTWLAATPAGASAPSIYVAVAAVVGLAALATFPADSRPVRAAGLPPDMSARAGR